MIKNSLLVMFSVLVSVLIVEAALRLIYTPFPLKTRMELVDAGVGGGDVALKWDPGQMRHQPLHTTTIMHAEYRNTVTIDSYGFRNPCPEEPIEGIMVGDSSVFGIGVNDEETFQCVNARMGIKTYSLGVSGAAPRHYIRLIEKHAKRLGEVFSVSDGFYVQYFLSLGNDFQQLIAFKDSKAGAAKGPSKSERRRYAFFKPINQFIYHDSFLRHSYVLQMLKLVAVSAEPQCKDCSYLALRGGDRLYRTGIDDAEAERDVEAVVRYFDAASAAASEAGAASVQFVLLRGAHIINKQRLDRDLALVGATVEEFNLNYQSEILARAALRRPEVTVIDTTECLKEYPQVADLHYHYDGHFTPLGIRIFMACLAGR